MANNKNFVVKNGLIVGTDATIGSTLYVSTVDTTDSSAITVVPSTTFNSDVSIENDLRVTNAIENASGNTILPAILGDADQVLSVNSAGNGAIWKSISDIFGGGIDNVVDDTTPQLGGDLDLNSQDITGTGNINITGTVTADELVLADNEKIKLGSSVDFEIYHDGSHSYVDDRGTGDLRLRGNGSVKIMQYNNSEQMAAFKVDGAVELYYDNVKKFETTSTGVDVTGNITATGSLFVPTIDTADSSAITVVPMTVFNSDVDVQNTLYSTAAFIDNLGVPDALYVDFIKPRPETGNDITISGEVSFSGKVNANMFDTTDSSAIVFTPAIEFESDVRVQNNLVVENQVDAARFIGDGSLLTNLQTSLFDLTDTDVAGQGTSTLLKYDGLNYVPTSLTENSSGDVAIESTDSTSNASPELELYKNSTSADGHYLGQIKFAGENDTGGKVNYAKITGKILDNTNGTEDGILEFAFQKAGSQNISARFRSDGLQLINGTNFTVNGTTTLQDTVTVNANIVITGTVDGRDVATDGAKLDTIESNATADQTAAEILAALITVDGTGTSLDADLLDGQHGSHYLDGANFTGTLPNDYVTLGTMTAGDYMVNVSGTANEIEITHTQAEGSTATIGLPDDVTIGNELTVTTGLFTPLIDTTDSSAITITPAATFNSDVTVENDLVANGNVTASAFFGDGSNLTGISTTTTFVALTDTDVASQATDTLIKYDGTNYVATSTSEDSSGNVTITGQLNVGTIDTTDSSAISVTPAATFNSDVTVENSLIVNNDVYVGHYIDFSTTVNPNHAEYQEGRLWYDSIHKTFNYYSDISNVVHELGIEQHIRVYNNSGSAISKGQPLYFTGNYENGHVVPTVGLANATSASKYDAQGLAAADIANGAYGFCQLSGQLFDLDTSGLTAGQHFYVGLTDGALQNASPSYPNYPVLLGWVVKSHATGGVVNIHLEQHTTDTFRTVNDAHFGSDVIVDGDLTVNGTQTITSQNNISTGSAFIYLNSGDTIGEANTTFTGSGLDDAYFSGHYTGTSTTNYYVRIDSTGTPDTFEWSKDNFSSTEATGVAITGSDQTLDQGISVNFGTTTGHTSGDVWSGTAAPANVDTGLFTNRNTGATGVGYTHAGLFFDITDEKWKLVEEYDPSPTGTIDTAHASYNEATLSLDTLEASTGTFSTAVTVGGNNVLTTASEIALGTSTTGNYVATIAGTANEVEVTGSGSETAAVTIGLPDDVTIGNELTVTTALFTPIIDTTDSSAITITPAAVFSSDVTIQNDLRVTNSIENAAGQTILPKTLGSAAQVLTVNAAGTGAEWAATTGGGISSRTEEHPTVTNGAATVTMGAAYTLAQLDVYLNGARMKSGTDYSVSSTTLTFAENLSTGDIVALYAYDTSENLITGNWSDLNDVSVTGASANAMVRYDGGNWAVSQTTEDSSGNVTVAGNISTSSGNVTVAGDVTATGSLFVPTIDTSDSSAITITPAAVFSSDVTVENDLTVSNDVTATIYYGDGSQLTGISAGATGGSTDQVFYENDQVVTTNYTISTNKNAMTAGPITINSGVTITIPTGSEWSIV